MKKGNSIFLIIGLMAVLLLAGAVIMNKSQKKVENQPSPTNGVAKEEKSANPLSPTSAVTPKKLEYTGDKDLDKELKSIEDSLNSADSDITATTDLSDKALGL